MSVGLFILLCMSNAMAVDVQINSELKNVQEQVMILKTILESVTNDYGRLREQHDELEQRFNRLSDEMKGIRNSQTSMNCQCNTYKRDKDDLVGKESGTVKKRNQRAVSSSTNQAINHWNDTTTVPFDMKGEKGNAGTAGPKGDTGLQGGKGEIGVQGPKGDKGERGLRGYPGLSGLPGSEGNIGMTGQKGEIGPMGMQGQKGEKGLIGLDMKIAFTATTASNKDLYSSGNIIIFDRVETNDGNYYNMSSGVFTCGESGTYVFTWALEIGQRSYVLSTIEVNGSPRMYLAVSRTTTNHSVGTQTIVLRLVVGDRVYIREEYHDPGSLLVQYSSFTGFKL